MKITVVINTRARNRLLERTLESLAGCELPHGFDGVLILENGAAEGAEAVARAAAPRLQVRYEFLETGGVSATRNHAVRRVGEGLIVWLDDDVRVSRDVLADYARAAAQDPDCFYGGPVGVDYEEPPPPWLVQWLPPSAAGWSLPDGQAYVTRPEFIGLNWATFADHVARAGWFDVRFGPGGSTGSIGHETEIQERMLALGLRGRYVSTAWVHHYVPRARCSPEWALERARRIGIWAGLRAGSSGRHVAGVPVWVAREAVRRAARVALTGPWMSEPDRFAVRREFEVIKGWARGSRMARRDPHAL
jgi:glycosyltransferase involved in cell wall biosynthesis